MIPFVGGALAPQASPERPAGAAPRAPDALRDPAIAMLRDAVTKRAGSAPPLALSRSLLSFFAPLSAAPPPLSPLCTALPAHVLCALCLCAGSTSPTSVPRTLRAAAPAPRSLRTRCPPAPPLSLKTAFFKKALNLMTEDKWKEVRGGGYSRGHGRENSRGGGINTTAPAQRVAARRALDGAAHAPKPYPPPPRPAPLPLSSAPPSAPPPPQPRPLSRFVRRFRTTLSPSHTRTRCNPWSRCAPRHPTRARVLRGPTARARPQLYHVPVLTGQVSSLPSY